MKKRYKRRQLRRRVEFSSKSPRSDSPGVSGSSKSSSHTTRRTEVDNSGVSTQDTLKMITSPWSTESWSNVGGSYKSWYSLPSDNGSSLQPKTTSTCSVVSPLYSESFSRLTVTIMKQPTTTSHSLFIETGLPVIMSKSTQTLSSWTLETFTSPGWKSSSQLLKVKYPWSPRTVSATSCDIYPSTLNSCKVSRESCSRSLKKHMSPMNRDSANNKREESIFDWILLKQGKH